MTPILAQSTDLPSVPAETLKWVLVVIVAIVLITAIVAGGWAAFFRKPGKTQIDDNPPPEFRKAQKRYNHDLAEQRYTDHERRIIELEQWRDDLAGKMEADKNEIVSAGNEREGRIRDDLEIKHAENCRRLNGMDKSIGALEAETRSQNQWLTALGSKLDRLPGEVIATLRNTGAIRGKHD